MATAPELPMILVRKAAGGRDGQASHTQGRSRRSDGVDAGRLRRPGRRSSFFVLTDAGRSSLGERCSGGSAGGAPACTGQAHGAPRAATDVQAGRASQPARGRGDCRQGADGSFLQRRSEHPGRGAFPPRQAIGRSGPAKRRRAAISSRKACRSIKATGERGFASSPSISASRISMECPVRPARPRYRRPAQPRARPPGVPVAAQPARPR